MMNNDNLPRYGSLPLNGSDLSFVETGGHIAENEVDVPLNSYYSMQNVTNNNNVQPYYRSYDISGPNEEWLYLNNGFNQRSTNFYTDYEGLPYLQMPEPPGASSFYPHFAHTNANMWQQVYGVPPPYEGYHDTAQRYQQLADTMMDDNAAPSYPGFENEEAINPSITETLPPFSYNQQVYGSHALEDNFKPIPAMGMPITPTPTPISTPNMQNKDCSETAMESATFRCELCFRFCVSAGGLKRHAKFCRASPANLENIYDSLKRPSGIATEPSQEMNQHIPINLTSTFEERMRQTDTLEPSCDPVIIPSITTRPNDAVSKTGKNEASARRRTCPQCSVVVTSERALVQHLASHNVRKPYECETCGSRFSRKFHLTRHVKQRGCDGRPRAQFPCDQCNKVFSRKDNLREHVKGHSGQSRARAKLPCPYPACNKKFQGRTQLQVHLNAHTGSRPYACDRCEKTFRSNAALKKHLRVHSGERPFVCNECKASFGAKETLNRHLLTHTCSKPHVCIQCGKGFIQLAQLKSHLLQHQPVKAAAGADPFSCIVCDRSYKTRGKLQHHYRMEHNEKQRSAVHTGTMQSELSNDSLEVKPPTMPSSMMYPDRTGESYSAPPAVLPSHPEIGSTAGVNEAGHPCAEPTVSCTQCSKAFIRRDCLVRHLKTKHRLEHNEALLTLQNVSREVLFDPSRTYELDPSADGCNSSTLSAPELLPSPESEGLERLEENIIELLSLLVEANALRNFGWPECSVDQVLQKVVMQCGEEAASSPGLTLAQRLKANTRTLFSFIVDDPTALESLFKFRSIEHVLEQVIKLAKSGDNDLVQLQF